MTRRLHHRVIDLFRQLGESYVLILLLAIFVGLFVPQAIAVSPHTTAILIVIFFLNSLRIDFDEVTSHFRNKRLLLLSSLWMLVVRPMLVFWLVRPLSAEMAVGLMVLFAMPAAMSSPIIAEMVGGKHDLSLVLTVTSSLLGMLTIPLVIRLAAGQAVAVDVVAMFWSLVKVVILPFLAAQTARRLWPKPAEAAAEKTKPFIIFVLGLMITGVIASKALDILGGLRGPFFTTLLVIFGLFIACHAIGYGLAFWRPRRERVTVAVSATYVNFTLAIFLTSKFFPDPRIFMPVILAVLPWSLLMGPFQQAVKRWHLAGH